MTDEQDVPKVTLYDAVTTGISPDAYAITLGLRLIANEIALLRRAIEADQSEGVSE